MSDSLQPHGLQHTRPPCPLPSPGVYSNSCPLSRWCHPTILSSVVPFPSCLQSFPASGIFQMSQLFISGGQSIGVSASASVLPKTIKDWFPLGWTGWHAGYANIQYYSSVTFYSFKVFSKFLEILLKFHNNPGVQVIDINISFFLSMRNVNVAIWGDGLSWMQDYCKNIKQNLEACLLILYHLHEIMI